MKIKIIILFAILSFTKYQSQAQTVLASSFGYNENNATLALMNAINSANDTIIVDLQTSTWKVGSMHFWDLNIKTIIFEQGVIVEALPGMFNGYYDCLFRFANCDDINIIGYGATLKMNKAEYASIDDSEFRHSINLYNSRNITIKGLTVIESGGDGLSIDGANTNYCENILVEDVRFLDHYRQGLSIMNVQNMTVRHCEFSGTAGILPEAGIDIEPYQTTQRVVNLLIENCRFEYNGWSGLAVNLFDLDATSLPVSITVRDCVFKNNGREENTYVKCEIYADDNHLSPVQGEVLFERCFIEESNYGAFYARKTASGYSLTFKDCTFQNVSKLPIQYNEPIALEVADYFNPSPTLGGIHFDNVLIQYDTDYSFFRVFSASTLAGIENITGHFTIVEPNGNSPILNGNGTQNNIEFTYTNQTSLPETIVNIDVIEQNAVECTQQAGEILFVRNSNNVSYPLGISYEIGGSADNGNDYHYLPQGIVIPSGANSKKIEILARQDDMEEDAEMAIFTITPSFLYQPGNFSTAEINLWDCEPLSAYEPNTTALELLIYPNPSDNQITLLLPSTSESQNILIFNKLGQLIVKHFNLENNERIVLNIEEIPSGIYFITYGGFVQKFIKN